MSDDIRRDIRRAIKEMSDNATRDFKAMVPKGVQEDLRKEAGLDREIDWTDKHAQEFWDKRMPA